MTTATTRTRKSRQSVADKAEALLANQSSWLRARDLANPLRCVGYLIPSLSEPGKYHLATPKRCDCTAAQNGRECCHKLAAAMYVEQRKAAASAAAVAAALLADDASFTEWLDANAEATRLAVLAGELDDADERPDDVSPEFERWLADLDRAMDESTGYAVPTLTGRTVEAY